MKKFIRVDRKLYVFPEDIESIEEHPEDECQSILTLRSGKQFELDNDCIYDSFKAEFGFSVMNWIED